MSKRILVVEDNSLNMKLFCDILQIGGYTPICCGSGMEALAMARRHVPDLVLMDMQLPDVSGLEVTGWMREEPSLRSVPIVALTAFAMPGDGEIVRRHGCSSYLPKPVSPGRLLGMIDSIIGKPVPDTFSP